jgi:hypothetical protein
MSEILPRVALDASFVAQAYRVSNDCEILSWMGEYLSSEFVAFKGQDKSNCKLDTLCRYIDDDIDDETALKLCWESKYQLEKIYNPQTERDIYDLRIFFYALIHDAHIFTCDGGLLFCCQKAGIESSCFKKAFYDVTTCSGENFFASTELATDFLFNDDNPFLNFNNNKRCLECCLKECDFSIILPKHS